MYLIATSLGLYQHGIAFDSFLANLLVEDGMKVDVLLCDGVLPACQMSKLSRTSAELLAEQGQSHICKRCVSRGRKKLTNSIAIENTNIIEYSQFITNDEIEHVTSLCKDLDQNQLKSLKFDGAPVGEHGYASALRFFARGDLENSQTALTILRKYVEGAIIAFRVFDNLFKTKTYKKTIVHHGIYTPQGLAVAAAKRNDVGIVTWVKSYRDQTFLLSHQDTYHHTMLDETPNDWRDFEFKERQKSDIKTYISSRRDGTNDWISFNTKPRQIDQSFSGKLECLLLTSVLWDAQVHYKANLFDGILDWTLKTIQFWIDHKKQGILCIRIHPAEVTGYVQSKQKVADEISKKFPNLPENIIVIPPEDTTSTYDLVDRSQYVSAYSTKATIEVAMLGKPILVCGDAWIRNKGISTDPKTEVEYFDYLKKPSSIHKITKAKKLKAQKYAYHFFMRRMLEIDCFESASRGEIKFNREKYRSPSSSLQDSIDTIRSGIYRDESFLLKSELINQRDEVNVVASAMANFSKCGPLKSEYEVEFAINFLEKIGLQKHHDVTKNWDLAKALTPIINNVEQGEPILDAGCGQRAHAASNLAALDFKNIYACDLIENEYLAHGLNSRPIDDLLTRFLRRSRKMIFNDTREYEKKSHFRTPNSLFNFSVQDICNTNYSGNFFSAVISLSVIEHLSSPEQHIAEAARILRPKGHFMLTTDYWPIKVHTTGIYPYGRSQPEMRVFSEREICELIRFAKRCGLELCEPISFDVTRRLCNWERVGKAYTFIFLHFLKT